MVTIHFVVQALPAPLTRYCPNLTHTFQEGRFWLLFLRVDMVWAKKSCFQLRFSWKCHQLIWIVQWWIWEWQSKFGFDVCLFFPQTSFIPIHWLMNFPRLCALISYILISSPSNAYFRTRNRKNMSQRKFLGRALFSSLLMFFWPFYSFFSFCFNFWGRGAAAVRLLLRSPPLHQLSHLFPEFPEFSPIYLQSPRFQCFIATMQVSSIWSSTFPKKSETFFA